MKTNLLIPLLMYTSPLFLSSQHTSYTQPRYIDTKLGLIATYTQPGHDDLTPLIFLHGVYFDHHLWDEVIPQFTERTVITLDMPWHGASKTNIPSTWSLNNCAEMLVEILDALLIRQVIAVGHSWGSMTILRAAHQHPERFASIGLCNMPYEAPTKKMIRQFKSQHAALIFRNLYMKEAGKALFGKESLAKNPGLLNRLISSMKTLTNRQIKRTDQYVIIEADDAIGLLNNIQVPVLCLKGVEDYVPTPPNIPTTLVPGGHVSPLEAPDLVNKFCQQIIQLNIEK
jgi:3-oxoadipate enol-lactonase